MTSQVRSQLVIVNTGCANINSVRFAFARLGVSPAVSDDTGVIASADKVILPGVGSAQAAMTSIEQKQLTQCLTQLTQPVLGICLGMQLLATASQEASTGQQPCLGVVPQTVERLNAQGLRLPHMGWNQTTALNNNPLFKGIDDGSYFYYVHSFALPISEYSIAYCDYGSRFSAAINRNNYYAVQFHPERSGDAGAQLLENFIQL